MKQAVDPSAAGPARVSFTAVTMLASLLWALAVFAADLVTGADWVFAPFYMAAVVFAAWQTGRTQAFVVALACAALGVLAELLLSDPAFELTASHGHPAMPFGNGAARLVMYLVVGAVVSALRAALRKRDELVQQLTEAMSRVRTLQELLPMCAWCKQIRDDEQPDRWLPLERYIAERTSTQLTHGICPDCAAKICPRER